MPDTNDTSASAILDRGGITPHEISRHDETGVITVVIRVDDLPEGTAAIETPDGEILYISDAKNGVLVIKVFNPMLKIIPEFYFACHITMISK